MKNKEFIRYYQIILKQSQIKNRLIKYMVRENNYGINRINQRIVILINYNYQVPTLINT